MPTIKAYVNDNGNLEMIANFQAEEAGRWEQRPIQRDAARTLGGKREA